MERTFGGKKKLTREELFAIRLARQLGFWSRAEMFAVLTWEEWNEHLTAFIQDPDDEQRKDDRNAVHCLWTVAPHCGGDDEIKLPGFNGPAYQNDADDIESAVERIKATQKKRQLNGQ